jgi:hypothetical protein
VDELNQNVILPVSGQKNEAGTASNQELMFEEKEMQVFHDARHNSLCYNDNGKVLRFRKCNLDFSPIDWVDITLKK